MSNGFVVVDLPGIPSSAGVVKCPWQLSSGNFLMLTRIACTPTAPPAAGLNFGLAVFPWGSLSPGDFTYRRDGIGAVLSGAFTDPLYVDASSQAAALALSSANTVDTTIAFTASFYGIQVPNELLFETLKGSLEVEL